MNRSSILFVSRLAILSVVGTLPGCSLQEDTLQQALDTLQQHNREVEGHAGELRGQRDQLNQQLDELQIRLKNHFPTQVLTSRPLKRKIRNAQPSPRIKPTL